MRLFKPFLFVTLPLLMLIACRKEDDLNVDDIPGLGGDTWVKGPIDQWLYDTLTKPFNIATKYKWDQFELEVNKTIVPPMEEKIIPVMRTVKKMWIEPYIEQAGELFFKKYSPKFFVLTGSASWNLDGSITLGTAEGGRKVVLYLLNEFRNKTMPGYTLPDSGNVKEMAHVIHHEFTHILDQNIRRQIEFDAVCAGFYTSDWINNNDQTARNDGFVTAYALSRPDEDFAEMVSIMLIEGRSGFDNIVNSITGTSVRGTTAAEAKARLRLKESIVVNYFKQSWNVDFYSLQTRVRTAIANEIY